MASFLKASQLGRRRLAEYAALRSGSYDAIIIGAGVIGNSIATELSRSGRRTLNIDKLSSSGSGSTGYSSGICRLFYSIPDSVKFAWEGHTYWQRWDEHIGVSDENGLAHLREKGGLVLRTRSSKEFLSKVTSAFDMVGVPYEWWDNEKILDRFGFASACYAPPRRIDDDEFGEPNGETLNGALYCGITGYVSDPKLAAQNLQTAAVATGRADFMFNSEVRAILRSGGRVSGVRLADGSEVHAPVVINVAGPHSSQITKLAFPDPQENDMCLSTRAMRQEVAYVEPPQGKDWGDDGEGGMLCTDVDTGVYFRPEVGGKILVGSVEPACDTHTYHEDPESVYPGRSESALTDQWTNQVYRLALRMPELPLPDSANTQGCVACYDVTEDWVPIYDKSALPGYYMAIGTSGNQFKNAGVVGRLMKEIIEATEGGRDLDTDPLQFELKRIPCGGTVNAATFSRKRSLLATSGSVMG
jgi:sarcosine oxidase subunit beta